MEIEKDKWVVVESTEDELSFVYIPSNYPGPIAIDAKVSKELDEYHKNSIIQINLPNEPIPLSNESIFPLPEKIPVKFINVKGREEHEALLKDYDKMNELGLDPIYETMAYLRRWGDWLAKED